MTQSQPEAPTASHPAARGMPVSDSQLVEKVTEYVKGYMSHYDGSHDYNHILRVLGLARLIASASSAATVASPTPQYDPLIITLSALLHDVGDQKYLAAGERPETMVEKVLLGLGAEPQLAQKVQGIVSAVSYSSETKSAESRERVARLVKEIPELGVVQDADRLDAIGSVGIGRTFTFGGAVGERDLCKRRGQNGAREGGEERGRGMNETIEHFTDKLEKLEGLMKTEVGRRLAAERTRRLKVFREWWAEEVGMAEEGLMTGR